MAESGTVSGSSPPRRAAAAPTSVAQASDKPPRKGSPVPSPLPYLLDFFPREDAKETRVSAFFDALRQGRLTSTQCPKEGVVLWPPRVVCPQCRSDALTWVDLPQTGTLYAFSAVLAGAPLGMEEDVPFVVGLVQLDGSPLKLFSRIVGAPYEGLKVGDPVRFETFPLADGRIFYRFRAVGPA